LIIPIILDEEYKSRSLENINLKTWLFSVGQHPGLLRQITPSPSAQPTHYLHPNDTNRAIAMFSREAVKSSF
jgi:hypothetical protein